MSRTLGRVGNTQSVVPKVLENLWVQMIRQSITDIIAGVRMHCNPRGKPHDQINSARHASSAMHFIFSDTYELPRGGAPVADMLGILLDVGALRRLTTREILEALETTKERQLFKAALEEVS